MVVYFGFIFLGELDFGGYGVVVGLFMGFFCLMFVLEFY